MALKVPNYDQATYPPQSALDTADIGAIVAGIGRTGVLTGCAVTQRGAGANMSVDVAAGTVAVSGVAASISAANKVIGAADATNPRIDLVVSSSAGVLSVIAGTAAASPEAPESFDPATQILLAAVYVPANATTVVTAQIIDKRVLLWQRTAGMAVFPVSGRYFTYGGPWGASSSAQQLSDQSAFLYPLVLARDTAVDQIGIFVSTAGSTGSTLRFAVFDDSNGQVGPLRYDSGTISATTTGDKLVTVAWTLPAGTYWVGVVSQGAPATNPTVRAFGSGSASVDQSAPALIGSNTTNLSLAPGYVHTAAALGAGALSSTPPTISYTAYGTSSPRLPMIGLRASN